MRFKETINIIENVVDHTEGTEHMKKLAQAPEVIKFFKDAEKHKDTVQQISRMLLVGLGVHNEKLLLKKFFSELEHDPKFILEIRTILKQYPDLKHLFKELSGHVIDAHFVEEVISEINRDLYTQQYAAVNMKNKEWQNSKKAQTFTRVLLFAAVLVGIGTATIAADSAGILDFLNGLKKTPAESTIIIGGGIIGIDGKIAGVPEEFRLKSDDQIEQWIETEGKSDFDKWLNFKIKFGDETAITGSDESLKKEFVKEIKASLK
jgi:hypothetical protein